MYKTSPYLCIAVMLALLPCRVLGQSSKESGKSKITDTAKVQSLDSIVISTSKISETFLNSTASVESLNISAFKRSASPSFFDALEQAKGVQMITPSLGFRVINMRGFGNTTNVRFSQLVDGMDNQAPHIGAPIGNTLGPSDLDIQRVEIISGNASALYGLNAINGLANFITKNPFTSPGIMFQQKTGLNHVNDPSSAVQIFSETNLRIAKKLSPRWAVKANFSMTVGKDWTANNLDDLNPPSGGASAELQPHPGYDPVSGYGNESPNRRRISLNGKQYLVARTGYLENELTDYNIRNFKTDFGASFMLSKSTMATYTYRLAQINNVYQRANRFALKDYWLSQHALELKSRIYQMRGFVTFENTGKSYNLRSLAENIDRKFKPDDLWFSDYAAEYNSAIKTPGLGEQQSHVLARVAADRGRLQPGTQKFQQALTELSDINNWDIGAALRVHDHLIHAEAQVDIGQAIDADFSKKNGLNLLSGVDYQDYVVSPDGNYFINPEQPLSAEPFHYSKTGGFILAEKWVMAHLVKVSFTLRADRSDYFSMKFNPRIAAVIRPTEKHSLKVSYQSGNRFPSIFEAFSNVNSGGVKRVGGLKVMSNGVFENGYLRSSIDRFQAAVANDINAGSPRSAAVEKQKNLLIKNSYSYLKPEHINAVELGYNGMMLDNRLKIDADVYYNKYKNFIAQIEMNVANPTQPDSIPFFLNDRTKQVRYRIYTNSQSIVFNQGASLGANYFFFQRYMFSARVSYAKLKRSDNSDGFEDGFNTPEWTTNISAGAENLFSRAGFLISYRHQSGMLWQSFLANGRVNAYGSLDAQFSYRLSKSMDLKVGGTNVLNNYYYSYLGGPAVGGFYYSSLTLSL